MKLKNKYKTMANKTIKQWLEELPEPYRTEALNETPPKKLNAKRESLEDAILTAFLWEESEKGYKYWADFVESLQK